MCIWRNEWHFYSVRKFCMWKTYTHRKRESTQRDMTIITECHLCGKYAFGPLKSFLPSYLIITKQFFWDVTIPNFLDCKTEDLIMGNIRLLRFLGLSLPILGSCVLRITSGYRTCISHLFFFCEKTLWLKQLWRSWFCLAVPGHQSPQQLGRDGSR